jgi:hypothetical protein
MKSPFRSVFGFSNESGFFFADRRINIFSISENWNDKHLWNDSIFVDVFYDNKWNDQLYLSDDRNV